MMGLSWPMPGPLAITALGALLLGLCWTWLCVWRRLAHRSGRRWFLVTLLNLAAFTAVAALLAPPERTRGNSGVVTLHTEGATAAQIEHSDDPQYILPEVSAAGVQGISLLSNAGQLTLREPGLEALRVTGFGLAASAWGALPEGLAVEFQAPAVNGPVAPQWPRVLRLGETLTVSGTLMLASDKDIATLELLDPAGLVVATADRRSGQDFALNTVPRAPGALLYRLRARRGESLLSDDPVGLEVQTGGGARLLILQSAPSFETRQLANWAGDLGNPVLTLTDISAQRTLSQALNFGDNESLSLNPALLGETDMTLAGGRAWVQLSRQHRQWILQAVENGMGLMLFADETLAQAQDDPGVGLPPGLRLLPQGPNEERIKPEVWPLWPGSVPERPLPLSPWLLGPAPFNAISWTAAGSPLEAWVALGRGRLALSTLQERHRWLTAGDGSTWTRYWAHVLAMLARARTESRLLPPPATVIDATDARVLVCAEEAETAMVTYRAPGATEQLTLEGLTTGTIRFPARCGAFWAETPGWYETRLTDSITGEVLDRQWRHIPGDPAWQSARRDTRAVASAARAGSVAMTPATEAGSFPVNPLWAWLLLVLATGMLWLERKLDEA